MSNRVWVDRSYDQKTHISGIKVHVHNYVGCAKDEWFMSDKLFTSRFRLKAKTVEAAKSEAEGIFIRLVTELYEGLPA